MKKFRNIALIMLVLIGGVLITAGVFYNVKIGPVDKNKEIKEVIIESGTSLRNIGRFLQDEGLIKDEKFFYIYLRLNKVTNIEAGKYNLSSNMGVKKIVEKMLKGGEAKKEVSLTFREGLNMRGIAKVIEEGTNNSYDSIFELLKNSDYIDQLISKYSFLDKSIKKDGIYYPLEGYLYPETYKIYEDATVEDIFDKMLDQMQIVLNKYDSEIKKSDYSIHEILTLASLIEAEAKYDDDRANVASVFFNRLKKKMTLGSDVTTYYAAKKDYTADLTKSELNMDSPYNTRNSNMAGKLPIGPISNPRESSIKAVLDPSKTSYLYFVSDKNGKLYFSKTYTEHNKTIAKLEKEGLWFEW